MCRLLDLCHGPGWGLEAAIFRFPAIRVTAVDFTDVFRDTARARAESAQASNRSHPDEGARHVPSFWLRVSALAHDFAESVCAGWEGFAETEETIRTLVGAGFQGSANP